MYQAFSMISLPFSLSKFRFCVYANNYSSFRQPLKPRPFRTTLSKTENGCYEGLVSYEHGMAQVL